MSGFRRRLMTMQGGESALEPCIYTTTEANRSVRIINKKEYAQRIYLEDGTELDVSGTGSLNYTFSEIGDHKVWIEFKEDITDLTKCFYLCDLISVPESLFAKNTNITKFNGCFSFCMLLKTVPDKLFAKNTIVTSFYNCFRECRNITSSCPTDDDGTPIYNRSKGKDGYAIVTSHTYCFLNCTEMADYYSIPSDWKQY